MVQTGGQSIFDVGRVDYGLITKPAPTSLPPGAFQQAANLRLDSGRVGSGICFSRFTNLAPNDYTIKLNGNDNYFRGKITDANNLFALNTNDLTFEFVFRIDTFRSYQVLFHRGQGTESLPAGAGGTPADDFITGATDWAIYVRPNTTAGNGKLALYMWRRITGGVNHESLPFGDLVTPLEIVPGVYYHAVVQRDNGAARWTFYVHQVGTPLGTGSQSTAGALSGVMHDGGVAGTWDVCIGGYGAFASVFRDDAFSVGTTQGIVQEVRLWNTVRSTSDLEGADDRELTSSEIALAALTSYHPLLGGSATNLYFFSPSKGTAGSGASQSPIFELRPTGATWVTSSNTLFGTPIVGSGSVRFDGRESGLVVKDSYRYLSQVKAGDNALTHREQYIIPMRVRTTQKYDGETVFHWVRVPGASFTSTALPAGLPGAGATATENPATTDSIMRLVMHDVGAGVFQFTAILWVDDAGTNKAYMVTSNIVGGIVNGTSYAVSLVYSQSANTWEILVDSLASVSIALPAGHKILATPEADDQPGSVFKYWMALGRAIKQVRSSNVNTFDPNAVDVEYDYTRSFSGTIDQVLICGEAIQDQGPYSTPTTAFHAFLATREITRENVFSLHAIVLSAWTFEDLSGGTITDIGALGNSIDFREDPGHTHGRSGITTTLKRPFRFIGDHFYRTQTGGVRLFIGIGGGTVYSLSTGVAVTPICDGFRNDDDNLISSARFLDGLILCCGGKGTNYHLFQRSLYRLTIDPVTGVIPFGLEDQINPKASLRKGVYKYLFTFYSAITGKRSPVGGQIVVEIKTKRANVMFGLDAEMNQTYPSSGPSDNKEEFDLSKTAAPAYTIFKACGWYGTDYAGGAGIDVTTAIGTQDWWEAHPTQGAPTARRAKVCKPWFDKAGGHNVFVEDPEQVRGDEFENVIDEVSRDRVFAEANEDGTVTMKSCLAGGVYDDGAGIFYGPRLFLGDIAGAVAVTQNAGRVDWNVTPAPGVAPNGKSYTGTGIKGHGIPLPYSADPQTTHLEVWRTLVDDDTYRLAARIENGTPSWKDAIADEDLTGEVLDTTIASPPACAYVAELGGRMLFLAPTGNAQRAFFSDVGLPWSVPATNVVDFIDGTTLALTGAAPVSGMLAVFKADTTFILRPPSNEFVPFDIQTRFKDIGSISHFGIVQMNGGLVFPGERGFYAFDGNGMQYLSEVIQPTWAAFPATYKPRISGFWDRQSDTLVWGVASTLTRKSPSDSTGVPDVAATWCTTSPGTPSGDPTGWMALTFLQISFGTAIQDSTNTRRVFFADEYGYTYEWNPAAGATNYGVGSLTTRTTAVAVSNTASTFDIPKVTSYATLPDGYRGFFLTWQNAAGTIRETRQVYSDSLGSGPNTTIVVDHAFAAIPQVGDLIVLGSVEASGNSGQFSPHGGQDITEWTELYVRADKQAGSATYEIAWQGLGGINDSYREQEPPFSVFHTEDQITISNQKVDIKHSLGQHAARGARLAYRIRALGADRPFRIRDMALKVRGPTPREFVPVT